MQTYTRTLKDKLWDMESAMGKFPSIENGGHMPSLIVVGEEVSDKLDGVKCRGSTCNFNGVQIVKSRNMLSDRAWIYNFTGRLLEVIKFGD